MTEKERLQKIWREFGLEAIGARNTERQTEDDFSQAYCKGYADAMINAALMMQKEFNLL